MESNNPSKGYENELDKEEKIKILKKNFFNNEVNISSYGKILWKLQNAPNEQKEFMKELCILGINLFEWHVQHWPQQKIDTSKVTSRELTEEEITKLLEQDESEKLVDIPETNLKRSSFSRVLGITKKAATEPAAIVSDELLDETDSMF